MGWYNIGFLGFGFGFCFGLGYLCVFGFSAVGCALEVGALVWVWGWVCVRRVGLGFGWFDLVVVHGGLLWA